MQNAPSWSILGFGYKMFRCPREGIRSRDVIRKLDQPSSLAGEDSSPKEVYIHSPATYFYGEEGVVTQLKGDRPKEITRSVNPTTSSTD